MRHKYISRVEWSSEFFDHLLSEGYVIEKYNYSQYRKTNCGDIFQLTFAKEKSIVIASNMCETITRYNRFTRRRSSRTIYRLMYKLSPEGWQYLKEIIVSQNI